MLKNKKIIIGILLVVTLAALYFLGSRNFEVKNSHFNVTSSPDWAERSPISGQSCENYKRRPVAVMLSGVPRVRPLSGLQSAEMVFEMPVTVGGINRFMAVFVCNSPSEIGSLRSARHDFIPLAMGLDAIYAHWGGSHFALEKLGAGIMDNINALPNRYEAFYRKSGYKAPDDGFTSMKRLLSSAEKYNYRLSTDFEGYLHCTEDTLNQNPSKKKKTLEIAYPGAYKVKWDYQPGDKSFYRFRGGTAEIDQLTGDQITAKNIVVLRASQHHLEGQYNDVDIEGSGEATFFRAGRRFEGSWEKPREPKKSKLEFLTDEGSEFEFLPGPIWVEIISPQKQLSWR